MGFFSKNKKKLETEETIRPVQMTTSQLDKIIIEQVVVMTDTNHPNGKTIKLNRDNPTDSRLMDYIIAKIRRLNPDNSALNAVIKLAVDEYYNANRERGRKEKHMAEDTTAKRPGEGNSKRDWKKIAIKVGKIAIPVAAGAAVGIIGTAIAIKKPWEKSEEPVTPEPEIVPVGVPVMVNAPSAKSSTPKPKIPVKKPPVTPAVPKSKVPPVKR